MGDLYFNPETRDLIIKNGDFVITDNPSIQNGAIMRDAHCFSIYNPIYGIGLERVINSGISKVNYEMNRWKSQVKQDGATQANFDPSSENNIVNVDISISYV
jgi:hypothetical protein